ncbi:MAG: phosphoenolpyruvate hydrolase family protein, partial [Tagaea sp.]
MPADRDTTAPAPRHPGHTLRRREQSLLVGAAIGVGRAATAAERGGADFLLALNAGRLRVRGATSLAAMLPLGDANAETLAFARAEILGRVTIPVFFGACAADPALDADAFVRELAAEGFAGVANFPTVVHFDGRFRAALEVAGLGFAREVALLAAARRAGLAAFGYAKTREEIDALLAAEIDVLCVNFGWNAGGMAGFEGRVTLDEAAERARQLIRRARRARPATLCVVEGGPIVTPEQMYLVCSRADADGYVGGSTLDRVPFEISVMQSTSAFKTASLVGTRALADAADGARMPGFGGLIGQSSAFRDLMATIGRVAASDLPVLIVGEPGSGKSLAARAVHAAGPRRRGPVIAIDAAETAEEAEAKLFGREAEEGRRRRLAALETGDTTVIVERIERLGAGAQARLAAWLESGWFERLGGSAPVAGRARLIGTTSSDPLRLAAQGALREDLLARFLPARVDLPALRDRLED